MYLNLSSNVLSLKIPEKKQMISYESLQFRPNLEKIARNNQKSFLSTKNKYKDKGKLCP